MDTATITNVRTFALQPGGAPLLIVRVEPSVPGLYGLGCATFSWRLGAVRTCVDDYLAPLLIGQRAESIEDIWQQVMVNAYWRNGPVLNNALSGVDMALWDIKGKQAGMPCYQLWGGACRVGAAVYVHAGGEHPAEVEENVRKFQDRGFTHIRCQLGGYRGTENRVRPGARDRFPGDYFVPQEKLRRIPELFAYLRENLGDDVELLHDVHERLHPSDALWLAKALEEYRLFFLEDLIAPEDIEWLKTVRAQCATPMALGELFSHPLEAVPVITGRLIDFLRIHPSQMGGITPCMKLARMGEYFGVRTAWHGPGDNSPVGMAANIHMDLAAHSFGIQEWAFRTDEEHEVFPGIPEVRDGLAYANDRPGLGIDMNEGLAAKHPCREQVTRWTVSRLPDGTIVRP